MMSNILMLVVMLIGLCILSLIFIWILKKPIRGIFLSVFFLPVLVSVNLPIVGPKLALVDIFISMTGFAWFTRLMTGKKPLMRIKPQFYIPLAVFCLVALASFLNTLSYSRSAIELLSYVYLGAFFFLFCQIVENEEQLNNVVKIWIAASLMVVLFGLIQIFSLATGFGRELLLWHDPTTKITSLLRGPSQLPSYLISIFPVFLLYAVKKRGCVRYLNWIVIVLTAVVMLATGSKTGLVVMFGAFALFFLWRMGHVRTWGTYIGLALFSSLVLALVIPVLPAAVSRSLSILSITSGNTLSEVSPIRYSFLVGWAKAVSDHPWIGVGVGDFCDYLPRYVPEVLKHELHNTYLAIWAEEGLLGFLAFMSFLSFILKECTNIVFRLRNRYWRELGGALVIGFVANLIYGLAHFGLRHRHLWLSMAIIISITVLIKKKEATHEWY